MAIAATIAGMSIWVKDFAEFLWAVLNNWAGYATGGVVVALIWLWSSLSTKPIRRKVAIAMAVLFLVLAIFKAWRDQHESANDAKEQLRSLTIPRFEGSVDAVWAAPGTKDQDAILVVIAHVKNLGAPSIAEFSGVRVVTKSGRELLGEFGPIPYYLGIPFNNEASNKPEDVIIYAREDNLLVKASSTPIPNGGAATGWLYVVVHGISATEVLTPGNVLHVTVKDVRGRELAMDHAITVETVHKGLQPAFREYKEHPGTTKKK